MLFLSISLILVACIVVTMKLSKEYWYKEGILDERDRILDAYMKSDNPIRQTNNFLRKHLTEYRDSV